MRSRNYLAVSILAFGIAVVAVGLWLLVGCAHDRGNITEVYPCGLDLQVPAQSDINHAADSARAHVFAAIADGRIATKRQPTGTPPYIRWVPCKFRIAWFHGSGWLDGASELEEHRLTIATYDTHHTLSLIRWETTNYWLMYIGRDDLGDHFTGILPEWDS